MKQHNPRSVPLNSKTVCILFIESLVGQHLINIIIIHNMKCQQIWVSCFDSSHLFLIHSSTIYINFCKISLSIKMDLLPAVAEHGLDGLLMQ